LVKLNEQMKNDASGMVSLWDECGRMCLTRRVSSIVSRNHQPSTTEHFTTDQRLLNTTAILANETLSSNCVSWITPSDQNWFTWKPVPMLQDVPAVEDWLGQCTEIALSYLASSNFYNRIHEAFADRSTFGTDCMWLAQGKRHPLHFRTLDVGSFTIAEDDEGYVHRIFQEFDLTAEQAEQKFGRDRLPPDVINQLVANKLNEKSRYLHTVYPRDEKDRNPAGGPMGMPWASCYVHLNTKMKVSEGGFEELPGFAGRYFKWSEHSAYGVSPAMLALAEIRGVNYLEMLMATLAETTVNPRVVIPEGMESIPDLRAGGITIEPIGGNERVREWMTGGRFDVGIAIIERKEKAIGEIFHRSLFEQFNMIERQITAREVVAREAEKLARFSPAFTSVTSEKINPMLERVFMLLYRQGLFPPAPPEAMVQSPGGNTVMLFPRTVHTSRMALALQGLKKTAFANMLELFTPLATLRPEVFDNLNEDAAFRDLSKSDGLPVDYLKPVEEVASMREARAKAQQAQEQQMMMMEASKNPKLVEAALGQA
jgi:hypothetical protein